MSFCTEGVRGMVTSLAACLSVRRCVREGVVDKGEEEEIRGLFKMETLVMEILSAALHLLSLVPAASA